MNNNFFKVCLFLLIISGNNYCQYDESKFAVGINAVYTTSAKIYLSPFSSDPVLRNYSFPLSDIFNPSFELKYRLTEPLIIGLSVEYMAGSETGPNLTVFDSASNATRTIIIDDGFDLIPVELSLYYILPFSTEKFKFLMGGGAGYYLGNHIRKYEGESISETISRKAAFGIHVSASMDYLFFDNAFIHFEMKFRDPQFTVSSRYNSIVRSSRDTFDSKINVDGITFILGVLYQL